MSTNKDLVVKMTINSTDFDKGIKNAKTEMSRLNSQTSLASTAFKSAMKGMASSFAALGIAVGAKDMFKSFMHSTQEMGDRWDNTMAACKTSWQSFQSEIMLNGGAAVTKLNDMYTEARKLADLMDQYGSSQISQQYANIRYESIMSNAITKYKDAKKAGDKSGMASARKEANDALNEYVIETNKTITDAMNAAMQHAKVIGITDINEKNFWNKFDYLYNNVNRGELSSDAQLFSQYASMGTRQFRNEVWSKSHPTYMTGRYGIDMPDSPIARGQYAMKQAGYSDAQIHAAESEFRQSQVVDEKLQSQLDLLKNYGELNQRLDSWKRRIIQMEESSGGVTPNSIPEKNSSAVIAKDTTGRWGQGNIDLNNRKVVINDDGSISTELSFSENIDGLEVLLPTVIDGMIVSFDEAVEHYLKTGEYLGKFNTPQEAETYAEILHNRQDWYYNTYLKDPNNMAMEMMQRQIQRVPAPLLPYQDLGIPEEDIIEPETDSLVEQVTKSMAELVKQTQEAFIAANALGGAFSELGNLAGDNTFGRITSGMGGIISQAVATTQAMMTLAGAETVEGIADAFANSPGGALTKLALTATALAGILSMISTAKNAFAGSFADGGVVGGSSYSGDKLWARVNSGELIVPYDQWHNGGGNVHFVIEGSQLKGVLDNYESIENM